MKTVRPVLGLISAAILAFQVALTRFFSLAQGSHLAFMAVSLALLGAGASGTYLSLKRPTADLQRTLTGGAALFTLAVPASYAAINYLPFDAYRLALDQIQLLWLTLYYLALTVPFFFGGLVIGAALTAQPEQAGSTYAANLLGSGLGPPLALLALATVGGPGTVFLCALLGWLAVVSSQVSSVKCQVSSVKCQVSSDRAQVTGSKAAGSRIAEGRGQAAGDKRQGARLWFGGRGLMARHKGPGTFHLPIAITIAIAIALLYLTLRPPAFFDVRLTPYKSLSQALLYPGSKVIFSRWNAFSRVDVLHSDGIHSAPGLGFTYPGELPPQLGLTVDGDNLVPITRSSQPAFSSYLPSTLGFELRPGADILILEPGGGLAVLTALQATPAVGSVTVVQSNHTVVEAVSKDFADFAGHLYDDPRVTIIIDEPRSFLRRSGRQFDLIILPLTDSFRPVTAGAYTLNEDYRYTVEAFTDALNHLSPNGLLLVERWLQFPPSESLRLWATAIEALHRLNDRGPIRQAQDRSESGDRPEGQPVRVTNPAAHLLALRSLQTSLVIAARSPLSAQDLAITRNFAVERQFDLVWLPDIQPGEVNRYSVVPGAAYYRAFADLLAAPDPAAFLAEYPYAVAPPTDDHPFFFHFFKWQQTPKILQALGKTWQPFGGSGYLVLVVLLILVVILSAVLILLPLLWLNASGEDGTLRAEDEVSQISAFNLQSSALRTRVRYLLYFVLLGLGFLFVEIPLLQRFILYLGQPAYSFAVIVSALLAASGVGSGYLSGRLPLRITLWLITLLAVSYPLLLPYLFEATLKLSFAGRVVVTIIALCPLGLLLGVPFPAGLKLVGQTSPELGPWVWAVNGCASVISAVLAAMIALTWSFSVVLWSAAVAYALAGLVLKE